MGNLQHLYVLIFYTCIICCSATKAFQRRSQAFQEIHDVMVQPRDGVNFPQALIPRTWDSESESPQAKVKRSLLGIRQSLTCDPGYSLCQGKYFGSEYLRQNQANTLLKLLEDVAQAVTAPAATTEPASNQIKSAAPMAVAPATRARTVAKVPPVHLSAVNAARPVNPAIQASSASSSEALNAAATIQTARESAVVSAPAPSACPLSPSHRYQ